MKRRRLQLSSTSISTLATKVEQNTVKIMAICTGNICRSAMAVAVLNRVSQQLGVGDSLQIDSAGTSSEEQGNSMDWRAVAVLRESGYNTDETLIRQHRAKKLSSHQALEIDLFVVMTQNHCEQLRNNYGIADSKIRLWRSFESGTNLHTAPDLADPWYGDFDDFRLALNQLEISANQIVEYTLSLKHRNSKNLKEVEVNG